VTGGENGATEAGKAWIVARGLARQAVDGDPILGIDAMLHAKHEGQYQQRDGATRGQVCRR
jgi:hypothetical protein